MKSMFNLKLNIAHLAETDIYSAQIEKTCLIYAEISL